MTDDEPGRPVEEQGESFDPPEAGFDPVQPHQQGLPEIDGVLLRNLTGQTLILRVQHLDGVDALEHHIDLPQ